MLKRKLYSFSCAVLLIFGALQTAVSAKDEWLQIRSKNFNLVGNASEKDIRRAATRLEQFRDVLSRVLSNANFASPVPTTVIVFKNDSAYTPYKPVKENGKIDKWIGGYFLPGDDVNYITLPVSGTDDFGTIFHEYTHFIVDNNIGRANVPPWFNEGLAEYYQTFVVENDREVRLGALQNDHLRLLSQNKLIPFDAFFSISDTELHEQSDDGVGLFYAQAWALMHYFINGNNGARQKQMYKFLELVRNNRAAKDAFAEAFLTDYATMEKELKNYIGQSRFTTSLITFKERLTFDAEMQVSPLGEAESRAVLGDLLYHSQRFAEAETHLHQALAAKPELAPAQISLALVKTQQKKFDEAKKYLEKALRNDSKNYLAHYTYAFILSREGMDENDFVIAYAPETAEKMRAALRKSIELNPKFAEAFNLISFVALVQNTEIDEALVFTRRALALAPGNQYYLIRLAQLDSRKGNYADAKRLAQKIYETAADDSLKNYAQSTLRSIETDERQAEQLKNFQTAREKSGSRNFQIITEKELSPEEETALRAKIFVESLNQALRKPVAGEKRVVGYLSKIQCGAKGITYHFKSDDKTLIFTSPDFASLELVSYDEKSNGAAIGCDSAVTDVYALLTFVAGKTPNAKTAGEVVAIEFLPAGFKPQL